MEDIEGLSVLTDVYDKICEVDELEKAYRNARKGKRYRYDVLKFADELEENLINLSNHLIWETYEVGPYHPFYVHEPKKRLVMSLQFPDRVVQWDIYDKLYPFFRQNAYLRYLCLPQGKGQSQGSRPIAVLVTTGGEKAEEMVLPEIGHLEVFLPSGPCRVGGYSGKAYKG